MKFRSKLLLCCGLLAAATSLQAAGPELGYSITLDRINPSDGTFWVTIDNNSRDFEFTHFEMTMGDNSRNFDAAYAFSGNVNHTVISPDENTAGAIRSQRIILDFLNFTVAKSVTFKVDMDDNPADLRTQLFNNGNSANAVVSITGSSTLGTLQNSTLNLTLPDGPVGLSNYNFSAGPVRRTLYLKSLVEAASDPGGGGNPVYVNEATVKVNGSAPLPGAVRFTEPSSVTPTTDRVGREIAVTVFEGDEIEIIAPQQAYRDLEGKELGGLALADPNQIRDLAEERFKAIGISVNDSPQTGDPTLYEFEIDGDTQVVVKWKHEYALRIESDFANTASIARDGGVEPWAGPLSSQATGDPTISGGDPSAAAGSVHWIERNAQVSAFINSTYNDPFQHPGLPIRYVPYSYIAYGAANDRTTLQVDEAARTNPTTKTALLSARNASPNNAFSYGGAELRSLNSFNVGQSPEPKHQIGSFTMYGPTEIRYLWKIQFGVEVAVDSAAREDAPKIVAPDGTPRNRPGVYWFDDGTAVSVNAKSSFGADSLTGWFGGDGYYFTSSGNIDASSGATTEATAVGTTWEPVSSGLSGYRGLKIQFLRRPAKVIWKYDNGLIRTRVTVGEYVFQNNPSLARSFNTEPTVKISPVPTNTGLTEQGIWDPEAAKYYPLGGGVAGASNTFRVDWVPEGSTQAVEVELEVVWPNPAHYPYVAGAPAVALDADPTDDWLFKSMKYSESNASVDDSKLFSSPNAGRSVLLFSNIQRQGRGQPREFLQVRVVETKTLNDSLLNASNPVSVVIGEKINDRTLDRAGLGTGYVVGSDSPSPTLARYNASIYDPAKLSGIAAKDVYDTDLLYSDSGRKLITNKSALPGPVIPVNLFPLSTTNDKLRVIWYDDPAQNDGLLWPHAGRYYEPRWPVQGTVGTRPIGSVSDGTNDSFGRPFTSLSGATDVVLEGQLAFIVSPTDSALSILDISNPAAPRLVSVASAATGNFNRLTGASAVIVQDGLAFVAAPSVDAVSILDVSNPVTPRLLSVIEDGKNGFDKLDGANSLAVSGDLLFVGAGTEGAVSIVDISDPTSPRQLSTVDSAGVGAIAFEGGVLYAGGSSLALFDVSNATSPALVSQIGGLSGTVDLIVSGDSVFVGRGGTLTVVSVEALDAPRIVTSLGAPASSLSLDRGFLYASSATSTHLFDVADPSVLAVLSNLATPGKGIVVANDLMLLTSTGTADFATYSVHVDRIGRIVIATQWGSESEDSVGRDQPVVRASGSFGRATTYDPTRLQQVSVYNQPNRLAPGYNPNEEHGLMAPSLRFAEISPRPSAAYALRDNDLNVTTPDANYTSDPHVLVQYFDVADEEFKMNVYRVLAKAPLATGVTSEANYTFADIATSPALANLKTQPFVRMEAGEPVIPFYPIGFVDGAVPCPQTYGTDLLSQKTYWEDHRGSNWAISGGDNAWFSVSPHYRLSPNFWWPKLANGNPKPGQLVERRTENADKTLVTAVQVTAPVGVGDCVSFLPTNIDTLLASANNTTARTVEIAMDSTVTAAAPIDTPIYSNNLPTRILYKSDWPAIAPVLKAGETLTFSGGEYRADHPTTTVADVNGDLLTVDTPGLPQLTAFAAAEVVFDSLNPTSNSKLLKRSWTARVAQVLDVRRVELPVEDFPGVLQPANGKTRVVNGKFLFVDLPSSLQKRVRYNPLSQYKDASGVTRTGKMEIEGLLNDKDIGDATLTASPPAVYVLEPNILTDADVAALQALDGEDSPEGWDGKITALKDLTLNPNGITGGRSYLVGLDGKTERNSVTGEALLVPIETDSPVLVPKKMLGVPAHARSFGPGLALVPNGDFLNPNGRLPSVTSAIIAGVKIEVIGLSSQPYPDVSWVTVVENNDPSLGGSPITPHVIKIDRRERYRGALKTIESDNVFDENLVLRHTGDFGANVQDLAFEWWYRPDDGSLNVAPPDLIPSGQTSPWKLFPDDSGARGIGRNLITLKGNPNAPETLIADTFWFARYRHKNEAVNDTDWGVTRPVGNGNPPYTWAGAGNSQPFEDLDLNGIPDFRAQLAQGWIKRVLDAVNPYEARIRDFDGDNPATVTSMLQQLGARFEGSVALNSDKNVIENVGLIELYETILKRGRDLTIDLSRPVASPAIANALQLASTRISDFYTLLGNEAYVDSLDPTIGIDNGQLPPTIFTFQNQVSSLLGEELGLLRGVDEFYARPVYNRMFWNFTKGEGEAAYALNYNVSDINTDGFINEDDAMILYPQGHGDAWGHYLTALRNQYELLAHPFFNWVSRSEFYNLQDITIKVDFLDERKFAQTAAAKAKAGAEIVSQTYRERYVEDSEAQWQGYTDSNKDRAWGVQGWARRAGQGAYFDWVTANALLPSEHPNATLEGVQKVDRQSNSDIKVISANLNSIQNTFDEANAGSNPLGVPRDAVTFDIDPQALDGSATTSTVSHFDQIYERAATALSSANAVWLNANDIRNRLRSVATGEQAFRTATFQEDLAYKNKLISLFGKPYEGTVGPGQLYPAGYDGPDLALYMYVNVREITKDTVPGPTTTFATLNAAKALIATADENDRNGSLFEAIRDTNDSDGRLGEEYEIEEILTEDYAKVFSPTFASDSNNVNSGLFAVNYTDLTNPKVPLVGLAKAFPIKAAGYTFQAPNAWGGRAATGELQMLINKMVQQEAAVAAAIGAWDGLQGGIVREARIISARLDASASIRQRSKEYEAVKLVFDSIIKGIEQGKKISDGANQLVTTGGCDRVSMLQIF